MQRPLFSVLGWQLKNSFLLTIYLEILWHLIWSFLIIITNVRLRSSFSQCLGCLLWRSNPYMLIENTQIQKSMFKEALLRAIVSFLSHWSDGRAVRTFDLDKLWIYYRSDELIFCQSKQVYIRSQNFNHQTHSQRDCCHVNSDKKNSNLYHSVAIFTHIFNTCQGDLGKFKKL